MAANYLQERIKAGELQWLIFLSIGLVAGGILLIVLSYLFLPDQFAILLLAGGAVVFLGGWLFKYIFDATPRKKSASKSLPKKVRLEVWQKYNGETFKAKCFVQKCKNEITLDNFHVGHNVARAKGGADHIDNLRPICGGCNSSMGTMSIAAYNRKLNEILR